MLSSTFTTNTTDEMKDGVIGEININKITYHLGIALKPTTVNNKLDETKLLHCTLFMGNCENISPWLDHLQQITAIIGVFFRNNPNFTLITHSIKHNWFTVINDAEGVEHKVYSNDNLSEFAKDDIIQAEGQIKSGKAGEYMAASSFKRIGEAMNGGTPAAKPAFQRTSENSQVSINKDDAMTKTGISTRGAAAILYGLTVANRAWSKTDTDNLKAALKAAKTIDAVEVDDIKKSFPDAKIEAPKDEELDDNIPF